MDGIPSQLNELVSQSQSNLPPQVVSHLSGFLAKVTPEMESQMSQGERERLELLRDLVRRNEAREDWDTAADQQESGADTGQQGRQRAGLQERSESTNVSTKSLVLRPRP